MGKGLIFILLLSVTFLFSCKDDGGYRKDMAIIYSLGEMTLPSFRKIPSMYRISLSQVDKDIAAQSNEKEASSKEEIAQDEKAEISDTFYVVSLIVIVIAAYFMNKRKPLLNQ